MTETLNTLYTDLKFLITFCIGEITSNITVIIILFFRNYWLVNCVLETRLYQTSIPLKKYLSQNIEIRKWKLYFIKLLCNWFQVCYMRKPTEFSSYSTPFDFSLTYFTWHFNSNFHPEVPIFTKVPLFLAYSCYSRNKLLRGMQCPIMVTPTCYHCL
jgi:hypothetical protein